MGSEHAPLILIELVLVFGSVLAFAWWQLRSLERDRQETLRQRQRENEAQRDQDDQEARQALQAAEVAEAVETVEASASASTGGVALHPEAAPTPQPPPQQPPRR